MSMSIHPDFLRAGFEARHPNLGETVKSNDCAGDRVTVFRPRFEQITNGVRACAWHSTSLNSWNASGVVTAVDAKKGRVQLHTYVGGTMECHRWFPAGNVCEIWFYQK